MHNKQISEIFAEFKTGPEGLTQKEAEFRLKKYGPNELKVKKQTPLWLSFLQEFTDLMVLILIGAAIIAAVAGETNDAIVIFVIVFINAIIGFVQKFKAEKAIEALKKLVAPIAKVIRDGKEMQIDAKLLVPGDLIILMEGDKISADARVIDENELECQEAALTGESMPVAKDATAFKDVKMGETSNMVFTGTDVSHGSGKAIVLHTGMDTKFGQIAHLTSTTKKDKSPLQKELFRIGVFVGKITFVISAILFAVGYWYQGKAFIDSFLFATAVAVAAVPEGLPATVTIALALGVQRLARKNAIVRQLSSVETLGSTTHICTDKTGTLTKNEMTVKELLTDNYSAKIGGAGYKPYGAILIKTKTDQTLTIGDIDSSDEDFEQRAVKLDEFKKDITPLYNALEIIGKISVLCNNSKIIQTNGQNDETAYAVMGDPTEGALLTMAGKLGFKTEDFTKINEKIYELAFDSRRKRMSVIYKDLKTDDYNLYMKGAPDSVLEQCTHVLLNGRIILLDNDTREKIMEQNDRMAKNALRVIAFAFRQIEMKHKYHSETAEKNMVFAGLCGIIDPPRPEVKQAVNMAKKAGIKVYIITGDSGLTAEAIAKKIGLISEKNNHEIITGKDLEAYDKEKLKELFKDPSKDIIFARVSPDDKLKIVSALKSLGHIVAVTGDGVNDAPALKRADIGVSMGIAGTDVSKEASNMVLADDSFSTIINAIHEGRTIYENMKKFIFYIFSCNIGELVTIFTAIIMNIPAPLTAILILAVDIGTDVLPALALGIDPPEKGIMEKKPRDPKAKIMDKWFTARFLYVGSFIGIIVVGAYIWTLISNGWTWGETLSKDSLVQIKGSTLAFALLVIIQMVNAYNARSNSQSVFKMGFFKNLYLLGAVIVSLGTVYIMVEVPFMQHWLHTTNLAWYEWFMIIGASFSILLVEEMRKIFVRMRLKKSRA